MFADLGLYWGASWGVFGASFGFFQISWGPLGASRALLGASWGLLGASWAKRRKFLAPRPHLGRRLGAFLG
eukprot:8727151-Pyramimonas_sp.AAC.1